LVLVRWNGKLYERRGSCKRCGKCCTIKGLLERDMLLAELWAELLDVSVERVMKVRCPHLKFEDGIAVCTIYPNRPDFCRKYPNHPKDIIDGCGYYFVEVPEV